MVMSLAIGESGLDSWDTWNSLIVRGSPTIQPRLEKIQVFFPQPKPTNISKGIFNLQSAMKKSHFS